MMMPLQMQATTVKNASVEYKGGILDVLEADHQDHVMRIVHAMEAEEKREEKDQARVAFIAKGYIATAKENLELYFETALDHPGREEALRLFTQREKTRRHNVAVSGKNGS